MPRSGAAHATPDELYYSAAPADILKAERQVPPMNCKEGPRSRFPSNIAFNAEIGRRARHPGRAVLLRGSGGYPQSRTAGAAYELQGRATQPVSEQYRI